MCFRKIGDTGHVSSILVYKTLCFIMKRIQSEKFESLFFKKKCRAKRFDELNLTKKIRKRHIELRA